MAFCKTSIYPVRSCEHVDCLDVGHDLSRAPGILPKAPRNLRAMPSLHLYITSMGVRAHVRINLGFDSSYIDGVPHWVVSQAGGCTSSPPTDGFYLASSTSASGSRLNVGTRLGPKAQEDLVRSGFCFVKQGT